MKYRHELKYYISNAEYIMLKSMLQSVIKEDEHSRINGGYNIRSLYFDDMYSTAFKEKDGGVFARRKYRIRIYNLSDGEADGKNDGIIRFELKQKTGDYIAKSSIRLTREQTDKIIAGDYEFLKDINKPLAQDIYRRMKTRMLRPAVIVDYDREAYVAKAGNVRITFDKNICGVVNTYNIFDKRASRVPVLPPGQMVLEVKYDEYLPEYIKKMLNVAHFEKSAISKYVMCRRAYMGFRPMPVYVKPFIR
jgi:hypothetical protein